MLEATAVRTTPTVSRLDGGVRHFVHRSARSWSGSVLKPRVNKLWRRLAGERMSEQASGQLTNLPNVTPTTETEPRFFGRAGVGSGFCSCLSLSFPLLSFLSRLLSPPPLFLPRPRPSKNNSRSLFIARLSCVTLPRDRFTIDVNEPRRFPKV